jgi:hypothetical protein
MKIAFYLAKNGDWVDKLISLTTFSKYSHCELVFSDGEFGSASARDGGVRLKYIEQNDKWEIFELFELKNPDGSKITQRDAKDMHNWFIANDGQKYDWPGAIMSLFGLNCSSSNKKYCSYVCALLLGLYPTVTPQKLFKTLIKEKMIDQTQNLTMTK